jgi:hypothetical protein
LSGAVAQRGKKRTEQMLVSELDLTKIQGKGDFPCPGCGAIIYPEDETDDVYTILEEKLKGDVLEELVIQCNNCSSQIRLTGFSALALGSL